MNEDFCDLVSLETPNYSKQLSDAVWSLFQTKKWTDLLLRVDGSEIMVHKFLLCIFAPKLVDLCHENECEVSHILVEDEIMNLLVKFIYKGQITVAKHNLKKVRDAASQFGMNSLVDIIDTHLKTQEKESEKTQTQHVDQLGHDEEKVCEEIQSSAMKTKSIRRSPLHCPLCEFTNEDRILVRDHLSDIHQVKQIFECDLCQFISHKIANISQHVYTVHSKEQLYKCEYCDFETKTSKCLDSHRMTHRKEKNYRCTVCDKQFNSPKVLATHMKTLHEQSHSSRHHSNLETGGKIKSRVSCKNLQEQFICEMCKKKYNRKSLLDQHVRLSHKSVKKCVCGVCFKSFNTEKVLISHMTSAHTDNSVTYSCDKCKFVTKLKASLSRHNRKRHSHEENVENQIMMDQTLNEPRNVSEAAQHITVGANSGDNGENIDINENIAEDSQMIETYQLIEFIDENGLPINIIL